jgi:hypothetical protein
VNTVIGAGVFVVTLAAQIAPVLAQAAGEGVGGVTPGAAFEAFRDALNVGVIGAVIWAIRWIVNNLGPKLAEAVERHNRLVEKLDQALDRMETNQDSVQRRLTELHQSCANWKPTK